jgi:hypothetical protein
MGLAETQRLLAHLYTDAGLRERFFAEPHEVGEAFGLGADETDHLRQLSRQQAECFASALKQKRLKLAGRLLPLTRRVLGERFAELFSCHAEATPLHGAQRYQRDAVAFSRFLGRVAAREGLEPPWVADLARYEAAWLEAQAPGCRLLVRRFRYAVGGLGRDETRDGTIATPRKRLCLGVWLTPAAGARVQHVLLAAGG